MKNKPKWELWLKDKKICKKWLNYYMTKNILRHETKSPEIFMNKALHNLSFANWLMDKHKDEIPKIFGLEETFYDWVIVAFYYSIYHAALALISKHKLSSKSHFATLCAVICFYYHESRKLTKNDIKFLGCCLEKEDIEAFVTTKSLRERASYGVSRQFELSLAEEAKKNAEVFLNKAKIIIT